MEKHCPEKTRVAVLVVLVSALLAALWVIDPAKASWLPACPFHALTGLYCPGCGTLRCLHQLLHGQITAAFALNPLVIAALPLVALSVALEMRDLLWWRPGRRIALPARAWLVSLAVIVGFGVARNIPVYPLTLLAPR